MPTPCKLRRAYANAYAFTTYANAYATYTVCIVAYARGNIFLVEFPLHLFSCIQTKAPHK